MNKIIIFFFIIFFSLQKTNLEQKEKDIINSEFSRLNLIDNNEKIYLDFNLNEYLISFLKNYTKSNDKISEFNNMYNNLSNDEIDLIFNKNEIDYLISNIKGDNFEIDNLTLPNNFILNNTLKEEENIRKDALKLANYTTKERLFLSEPIFNSRDNYSLIAYSYGVIGSMSGGIHIYKKTSGKWKFHTELGGWIE